VAFAEVEEHPQLTVLVGIAPDEPETAYGWIEPTPATDMGRQCKTLPVRRFWEKPSREVARELMATGCLWNTFIIVGQLPTLLGLFTRAMPGLCVSFSKIRPSFGTRFEQGILGRLYEDLRPSDFSRRVLESAAPNLSVLPVSNVGWSDLGEPQAKEPWAKAVWSGRPDRNSESGKTVANQPDEAWSKPTRGQRMRTIA
jgi:mannose-1-phosphate guanylyltransferase